MELVCVGWNAGALSLSKEIDWEKLATDLGALTPNGETGGSEPARRALELLIGEDALRSSVDYYIDRRPGSELARSVLWQLRPWCAMSYCYEIFKGSRDVEDRRTAVELLRVVADARVIPWITEFLKDNDLGIQDWGIGVLDQLLWSELTWPDDVEDLIETSAQHQNEYVRERVDFIKKYLHDRVQRESETTDSP
jgi:hypothetical protein